MIIDLHTHNSPDGILSIEPVDLAGIPETESERLYSVGFHPWNIPPAGLTREDLDLLERLSRRRDVIAIGECGIDLLRGPVLAVQMNAFLSQAEIAIRAGKPVIVHCVKGYEQVIGIRKKLRPERLWAIHGFRGKPTVARMLINAGFMISIGENFNPAALAEIPDDMLLVETDESGRSIEETIAAIATTKKMTTEETTVLLSSNLARFLKKDD